MKECTPFVSAENGTYNSLEPIMIGDYINISCNTGFFPIGPKNLKCGPFGILSCNPPECKRKYEFCKPKNYIRIREAFTSLDITKVIGEILMTAVNFFGCFT